VSFLDDIPNLIFSALSEDFREALYEVDTPATGSSVYDPDEPTTSGYSCRALVDDWDKFVRTGGLVAANDVKIMVLAATLSVTPQEGGRITIQGMTYGIVSDGGSQPAVTTDPARAVWTLRGRA
jgi:hypothetical protein